MKQLQLSPPLLILVMGYPGAGKSFFARQFSEQYGIARISEDRIRYELFADPTFSQDESEILSAMTVYMLEQLMQTKSPIVCDANLLTQKERKKYAQLAQKNGYRCLTVWLQTDAETAAVRAAKRDKRNPDSKYSFDLSPNVFESLRSQLERPAEKELSVVVSGKHAFKSQCLTVLRKIATVYSEGISSALKQNSAGRQFANNQTREFSRTNRKFIQ